MGKRAKQKGPLAFRHVGNVQVTRHKCGTQERFTIDGDGFQVLVAVKVGGEYTWVHSDFQKK